MDDIMHMHLPGQRREGIGRRSGGRRIERTSEEKGAEMGV